MEKRTNSDLKATNYGKTEKPSCEDVIIDYDKSKVIQRFLHETMSCISWRNTIIITIKEHLQPIFHGLLKMGLRSSRKYNKGNGISYLELPMNNVRIIALEEFVDIDTCTFVDKMYPFPESLISSEFYNLTLPPFVYFLSPLDTPEREKKKQLFYESLSAQKWTYLEELYLYLYHLGNLILYEVLDVMNVSFRFQDKLKLVAKEGGSDKVKAKICKAEEEDQKKIPISSPLDNFTSASHYHNLLVFYGLDGWNLEIPPNTENNYTGNCSQFQYQFEFWIKNQPKRRNHQFKSAFLHKDGVQWVGKSSIDVVDLTANEFIFLHSCYHHGGWI